MRRLGSHAATPLVALWLLFGLASTAAAHDVGLRPSTSGEAEPGALVRVELWQGHADSPELLMRNDRRLLRLEALGPDGETLTLPGLHGRSPAGVFRPPARGVFILLYEGRAVPYELPARRFEAYLEEEGLDHVLEARRLRGAEDTAGRELVSRSLKALVPVAGATLVDRAVGLPAELVLERRTEGETVLRVLRDGRPAPGVLVDLQRLAPETDLASARSDAEGHVRLPGCGPGTCLAAAVLARPLDSPDADWRTVFTTLTFPAAAGDGRLAAGATPP